MFYVHKYEEYQQYGGPEEGGWWYDVGVPVEHDLFHTDDEEQAYEVCRAYYEGEYKRRKEEEDYEYTSVLSSRSTFYAYDVSTEPVASPYPHERPHYE